MVAHPPDTHFVAELRMVIQSDMPSPNLGHFVRFNVLRAQALARFSLLNDFIYLRIPLDCVPFVSRPPPAPVRQASPILLMVKSYTNPLSACIRGRTFDLITRFTIVRPWNVVMSGVLARYGSSCVEFQARGQRVQSAWMKSRG